MKCVNCKFDIPSNASVCGHCGHPTAEQHKHRNKFFLSILVVAVPYLTIAVLLDVKFENHVLLLSFLPWVFVALVFKLVFKGEFRKAGLI